MVKKFEFARKELEERDLKLIKLERQVIYSGNEENNFVYNNPPRPTIKERPSKVAGRIVSSGRKRTTNKFQLCE